MYFQKLNQKQKISTLERVNNLFEKHFWHEFRKFQFQEFENRFPHEYHNIGVDKLEGEVKEFYEKQNRKEIGAIDPIYSKITEREAKKRYIKDYKSPNKQRGKIKGWLKNH